jgi:20S proteasome alpha/beta subunit
MTQALAGFNQHGLILATDSRATRFDPEGRPEYFTVEKLFPLSRHCAILSGGAGVSVPLTLALRQEITKRRGLEDLEEIVDFSVMFLSRGYARHLAQHGQAREGLRRIYFILAGFSPNLPPPGFHLSLLGSEEDEPLHPLPVGNVVVMPRNLGMEMRLFRALAAGVGLDELLRHCKEFLEKMAEVQEEVGPPFTFAGITAGGYRIMEPDN